MPILSRLFDALRGRLSRRRIPAVPLTIVLAAIVGVLGGYGSVLFTFLIDLVTSWTVEPIVRLGTGIGAGGGIVQFSADKGVWLAALWVVPAAGLVLVSWFTRRFAPEAQGHGVPEVIYAVARHDGVIRPRVSLVKILASGVCIGTGGSIGREGPIVQIGSSLGSMGIIRPGDLQRVLDSDIAPPLVYAQDIALTPPIALRTNANLLEALRDFGACDIETLPVESTVGDSHRIVGLLLRSDVMRRYREEMLRRR